MARRITRLDDEYFSWLYGLIKTKKSYEKLCKQLHEKEFTWFVRNDDNRCEDGLSLRQRFIFEQGLDESHLQVEYFKKSYCTVFEMMISVAIRINDNMTGIYAREDMVGEWFLILLKNLAISGMDDRSSRFKELSPIQEAELDDRLEILINRTYDFYGNGSLFPLKNRPRKDMSKVEIWYQMMLYLQENYGV